jgi:methionyl-tRNA formyltransferase
MSRLSVMIMCGRSPRHLYVANRLCEGAHPVAIVQETGTPWSAKKIVRTLRRGGAWHKAWRLLRDRRRFSGDAEARFFFGAQPARLARQDLLLEVPHINHPDVVALSERLQPDVMAVFGTSLIQGPLLSGARLGIFNLHGGLSPAYRGADCTFWALHNGQPDQVGCTLHAIDEGIDTGKIVAHICPEVFESDDELTLFWRAVRDSAQVYVEMLERLSRGERPGEPQREKGRLYQVKDRTRRAERQLSARMRNGLLRGLHLPLRVRWFGVPATDPTLWERHAHQRERQAQ